MSPAERNMPCFTMLPHSLRLFLLFIIIPTSMSNSHADSFDDSHSSNYDHGFSYENGFYGALVLDGVACMTSGALMLTDGMLQKTGQAFHWVEFTSISSFSTTFVFLIRPAYDNLGGHGLAFTLSTRMNFTSTALPNRYLGLLNGENNGNVKNQLFAVELDTVQSAEFADIDDNHVGIDINNMVSTNSHTAGYYTSNGTFFPMRLASGEPMQVWVDYDGNTFNLNVSLAPYLEPKPQRPLLSSSVNLKSVLGRNAFYAGFSSSTGLLNSKHYVIGWSFNRTGQAQPLNYSGMSLVIEDVRRNSQKTCEDGRHKRDEDARQKADEDARQKADEDARHKRAEDARQKADEDARQKAGVVQAKNGMHIPSSIILPTVIPAVFIVLVILVALSVFRKNATKHGELEIKCGPPSFTYEDLATATRDFSDMMVLGNGGFGKVYKGVLQTSKQNVAIKRVSSESKQGMKEFIAEVTILGHLSHRNLVQLLGYSRHNNELLLIYDYMPKGSLDRVLHDKDMQVLEWVYRLRIIIGIASGLFYLHEGCEKVVIHRDIKTSNVLLDNEMNARLGDFGLARLHNHGTEAHTTHLAGTWGYIAPELARHPKATEATDVFAFGVLMLEVVCGRRPIVVNDSGEGVLLTDWVFHALERGSVLTTVDSRLEDYIREEVELILKLGLLCSHSEPSARPCMRVVLQYLEKDSPLPDFEPCFFHLTSRDECFDQYIMSSVATATTGLSGGR